MCTAQGGNPLAEIIWYKNGIKVDSSYTTSGRASSNTYSFVASTEDNNARYRCESKNDLSPTPLSAEIILSVQCKYKIYIFIFFTLHSRIFYNTLPAMHYIQPSKLICLIYTIILLDEL